MTMSVEELRARILKLDSEINRQKKLLKKLEQDRSLARGQLNAVLDPVARLPLDISSEIFLLCAPHVPTVLLNICRSWTEIAKATSALWAAVRISSPCNNGLAEVLPVWFQRACNRPLSITIVLRGHFYNWNRHVSAVFWKHGEQLKHLEILDDDDFASTERDEMIDLSRWTSLPLLETLTIRCQHRQRKYPTSQILELLRQAPNIVECTFGNVGADFEYEILVLPTLRRFTFGESRTGYGHILNSLSLPALETLSLPMTVIFHEGHLLTFLRRSAAPLQDLALSWDHLDTDWTHLLECLSLTPSLRRFKMSYPASEGISPFFCALADSPSILSDLRNLTIRVRNLGPDFDISHPSWTALVRALSTRRMEIHMDPVTVSLPADILASLRELVLDGVKIHIGTEERNFVVTQ